jgi:hypothetical protein
MRSKATVIGTSLIRHSAGSASSASNANCMLRESNALHCDTRIGGPLRVAMING